MLYSLTDMVVEANEKFGSNMVEQSSGGKI